jgi:hypothetical protein
MVPYQFVSIIFFIKGCNFLKNPHNISMNQFNLGNFINKFVNYSFQNLNGEGPKSNAPTPEMHFGANQALTQNMVQKSISQSAMLNSFNSAMLANMKMNDLSGFQRTLYLKDLMNLPKELEEVLVLIQNKNTTTTDLSKLLNTNINLATLAELMQQNGKEAMNKLILVMSNSSKQGLNDLSQIKDAIKLINASVSVAGQDNPNQILKSFMLLYLPWLPLKEGVDFDLEIETSGEENEGSEISITILISTRNYGNVKATLVLLGGVSLSLIVNCSEKFPKEELLKRINAESKSHSMQTTITFEQNETKKNENNTRQAKISMSNLTKVNPFLLLMANAVIRHTIDLDNQG